MRDTTIEENLPAGWYFSAATNLTRWFGLGQRGFRCTQDADEHRARADNSQVRVVAGVVFGWGAR